jgi:cbb3-type cytochrome oxidase maturation protein
MGITPVLITASLALAAVGVGLFVWAVRDGQYDDLELEAWRILHDDPSDAS